MKKLAAIIVMIAAMIVPSGNMSVSSAATSPFSGKLLFSDEFNGPVGSLPTAGNYTDYSACAYNSSAAYGGIQCGNNEKLSGQGSLHLPITATTGSAIRVASKLAYTEGVWSAWMRVPAESGVWPAFWGLNANYSGNPASAAVGEVDAMEEYTKFPGLLHATTHSYDGGAENSGPDSVCGPGDSSFSTTNTKYSFLVASNLIRFYINGVQCGPDYTPANVANKDWQFYPANKQKIWAIFQAAIGGAGGQNGNPAKSSYVALTRFEIRALPAGMA